MVSDSSNSSNKNNKKDQESSPLAPFLKSIGNEDCDRPACDDTKSALTAALNRVNAAKKAQSGKEGGPGSYRACPPTKDEIGVSTWTLLHSMAAWYPNQPSTQDKQFMSDFVKALARFYPCTWCATDFQKNVELSPPRVDTREDLCIWFCEQHNIVNKKVGKPMFHCTIEKLDERWKKSSDPKCQR
ncbi:hypothetical protein ACHAW6_011817 [Cyclotella cf. meneghiniana]